MAWREIEGYKYPYRLSEEGEMQRWDRDHWRDVRVYIGGRRRVLVRLIFADGVRRPVPMSRLMANVWLGGQREGMCLVHKNGAKLDCGVGNLEWRTRSETARMSTGKGRKPVVKLNRQGEIVGIYPSIKDAAAANHISEAAVNKRCLRWIRDPYRLDGHDYRYEDDRLPKAARRQYDG